MIKDETRVLLQNIIQGVGDSKPADRCAEIRDKLIRSFGASRTSKKGFEDKRLIKEKQALFLRELARNDITSIWNFISDLKTCMMKMS